ncbi:MULTISPECIES: helix-turn-helix domain-containing protein [Paenibacillus]|jgi:transcriptional regulator with XRE-family HTH domain|uniref:Helix-turn-helix domain-containing protein n=1 Tax=Paenibacillus baimaensis TaxID=2982185 RepID=A0ABT2UHU2_9BACL|nr:MULTISPECIES: helix-turn-helix domain-containing protein [unclassified Paenibacillus]MCU6794210.1 helix-turn-helix domain-containing protein [Paenibacillus sp. WQ 127069]OMF13552.1 transcriptional regulator [Paenibacillus sp. FSL H7-0331]
MKYGHRIASLRDERHLTQEELAHKVGITRSALSHYENSRREPDYDTIQKIADFFSVSIDYLMGRNDDPGQEPSTTAQEFVSQLELSDQAVLDKFTLTIDGRELTAEEATRFIHFIRAQRSSS